MTNGTPRLIIYVSYNDTKATTGNLSWNLQFDVKTGFCCEPSPGYRADIPKRPPTGADFDDRDITRLKNRYRITTIDAVLINEPNLQMIIAVH